MARRGTRYVRCAHCAQTAATSQFTKRAGARGHEPCAPRRLTRAQRPVQARLCSRRLALPGCPVEEAAVNTDSVAGKAAGGAWAGRIGAAEKRRVPGRARSALRILTCGRLFERSERSERSEFGHRPGTRASQGTRSEAKGKPSEPRPGPARRLARAEAKVGEPTLANGRNGPRAEARFMRRGSRNARWSN